jgi:MFS superfamily sulfate permease-like transporter
MTDELSDLVATVNPPYDWILVDAEAIYNMDTTAVQGLEELIEDLHAANIVFALARLRQAVRETMDAAGLIEMIGEANIYLEVDDGVSVFLDSRSADNG